MDAASSNSPTLSTSCSASVGGRCSWPRSASCRIALLFGDLPTDPEGGALTENVLVPLQIGLLVVTGVGLLLSFRWMAVAAATVAFAGTGVAIISALQYEEPVPVFVALALLLPAVMMWLDWQCRETLGKIVALAVVTSALFVATWFGTSGVYDHFFGPTHPESNAAELPDTLVKWSWSGAVDTDGFTVTAVLREPTSGLSMVVTDAAGKEVQRSEPVLVERGRSAGQVRRRSTRPGNQVSVRARIERRARRAARWTPVSTFPDGPASLTLAFGGCARTNSNGAVFDTIRRQDPDLYVITGDLHYENIDSDDPSAVRHGVCGGARRPRSRAVPRGTDRLRVGRPRLRIERRRRQFAESSRRVADVPPFVPHYELAESTSRSTRRSRSDGCGCC